MLLVPSNCSRLLSTLGICTESVITGAAFRTADQLSIGIASSSGRPHPSWWPARHLHGSVQAGQAYKTARDAEQDDDDEPQTKRVRSMSHGMSHGHVRCAHGHTHTLTL